MEHFCSVCCCNFFSCWTHLMNTQTSTWDLHQNSASIPIMPSKHHLSISDAIFHHPDNLLVNSPALHLTHQHSPGLVVLKTAHIRAYPYCTLEAGCCTQSCRSHSHEQFYYSNFYTGNYCSQVMTNTDCNIYSVILFWTELSTMGMYQQSWRLTLLWCLELILVRSYLFVL